jgi:hypothetical protein
MGRGAGRHTAEGGIRGGQLGRVPGVAAEKALRRTPLSGPFFYLAASRAITHYLADISAETKFLHAERETAGNTTLRSHRMAGVAGLPDSTAEVRSRTSQQQDNAPHLGRSMPLW